MGLRYKYIVAYIGILIVVVLSQGAMMKSKIFPKKKPVILEVIFRTDMFGNTYAVYPYLKTYSASIVKTDELKMNVFLSREVVYDKLMEVTRPSTPAESRELKRQLEKAGYTLKVVLKRMNSRL